MTGLQSEVGAGWGALFLWDDEGAVGREKRAPQSHCLFTVFCGHINLARCKEWVVLLRGEVDMAVVSTADGNRKQKI